MTTLSLFDVLGPIMVGPSSSHTAGAVRIGWLARHVAGRSPERIVLRFHESLMQTYKGHATDSGLVAGLLGYREDAQQVRTALEEAGRRGISVDVECLNRRVTLTRCSAISSWMTAHGPEYRGYRSGEGTSSSLVLTEPKSRLTAGPEGF